MSKQTIDLGVETIPGSGEPLRDAFAKVNANADELYAHAEDRANPHAVTKAQVGLGNANNTSDADKPVSTAQQAAFDALAVGVGQGLAARLLKTQNLADLTNKAAARQALELAAIASDPSFDNLTGRATATQMPAFTGGDVTSETGSAALAIGEGRVGNAKLAAMAPRTLKGNIETTEGRPGDASFSAWLDTLGNAQGGMLVREQGAWSARAPGSVGQVWSMGTTGPAWLTPLGGGNVVGPSASVPGNVAVFGNAIGTSLVDSGVNAASLADDAFISALIFGA